MESQDYPIQHYQMMHELASGMKSRAIQILSHEYHYEVFGSWWFEFMRTGQRYRLVFDGKESELRLERNVGDKLTSKWDETAVMRISDRKTEGVTMDVYSLLDSL